MWELNKKTTRNRSYGYWSEETVTAAREVAPQFGMVAEIGDCRQWPDGTESFDLWLKGGPNNLSDFWDAVNTKAHPAPQEEA